VEPNNAAAVRLDLSGSGKIGGGFSAPDWGHWSTDQPAFMSLVLFGVIIILLVMVFKSLR
jgi:hypothetical protein